MGVGAKVEEDVKTRTVTVREGEATGGIDWSYKFSDHFTGISGSGQQQEACAVAMARLRQLCSGGEWQATTG